MAPGGLVKDEPNDSGSCSIFVSLVRRALSVLSGGGNRSSTHAQDGDAGARNGCDDGGQHSSGGEGGAQGGASAGVTNGDSAAAKGRSTKKDQHAPDAVTTAEEEGETAGAIGAAVAVASAAAAAAGMDEVSAEGHLFL